MTLMVFRRNGGLASILVIFNSFTVLDALGGSGPREEVVTVMRGISLMCTFCIYPCIYSSVET